MQGLDSVTLLTLWENGQRQAAPVRALALLLSALPDVSAEQIALWPLGWRDNRLFALRKQLFGPRLTLVAACPVCGEQLESELDIGSLGLSAEQAPAGPYQFDFQGETIRFTLPNSNNLLAWSDHKEDEMSAAFLSSCLQQPLTSANVDTVALADALGMAIEQADPDGYLRFQFQCQACSHSWKTPFDISQYLWQEIEQLATRLLWEVHQLAGAYGWTEAQILSLSAFRRQRYLELMSR